MRKHTATTIVLSLLAIIVILAGSLIAVLALNSPHQVTHQTQVTPTPMQENCLHLNAIDLFCTPEKGEVIVAAANRLSLGYKAPEYNEPTILIFTDGKAREIEIDERPSLVAVVAAGSEEGSTIEQALYRLAYANPQQKCFNAYRDEKPIGCYQNPVLTQQPTHP